MGGSWLGHSGIQRLFVACLGPGVSPGAAPEAWHPGGHSVWVGALETLPMALVWPACPHPPRNGTLRVEDRDPHSGDSDPMSL